MGKIKILIIAGSILLLIAGLVWWNWFRPGAVACTADAKLCPDGSYVGRESPFCNFAKCPTETGTVIGRVSVGPLCPVEPCDSDPIDFSSNQVILESQSGQKITVNLYADGTFYPASVTPGNYQVTLKDCPWLGCESELPKNTTVEANQTTEVSINIDTGIR